jgi:hypothetical protein
MQMQTQDALADELAALDAMHHQREQLLRRVREGAVAARPALQSVEGASAEREEALGRGLPSSGSAALEGHERPTHIPLPAGRHAAFRRVVDAGRAQQPDSVGGRPLRAVAEAEELGAALPVVLFLEPRQHLF